MQKFTLQKHTDNSKIFEGHYHSFKHCLEDAAEKQIDLSYICLKNKNLSNSNLDGAHMPGANFSGTNLTGANLSECVLTQSSFINTTLYNTCMAYTDLRNSDFRSASFGATHIEGSNIRNCIFSTLSCFDLDFTLTKDMGGCIFLMPGGEFQKMSNHPIVVKGIFNTPIVILDSSIKIGEKLLPKTSLPALLHAIENHTNIAINNNIQSQKAMIKQ